jgi:hypothetical protein
MLRNPLSQLALSGGFFVLCAAAFARFCLGC